MQHEEEWRRVPFRTFVLKIHGRCNLRCDYCYVYTMADQGWRSRPRAMSRAIIDQTAFRIAEHVATHRIREVGIVLHGGEPLLAGPDAIAYSVTAVRRAIRRAAAVAPRLTFDIQTNGLLLDEEFLELFEDLDVRVGLSLDGDRDMNDRHRRGPDGAGSYAAATAAAARLARHPGLFSGFLGVIDVRNDPVRAYESLLPFGPPAVDFLLPHGNWSAPPPGRPATGETAPYGEWLTAVFDRWYRAPEKETSVRLFEEIMNLVLGGSSATEAVGASPVATVVVETDGSVQQSDMLTAAYPAAGGTGRSVAADPFDSVLTVPAVAARQRGPRALAATCRNCPVVRICGGGLYEHRYKAGTGFDNPSVYCPDLFHLISHVRARMTADLARLSPSVP